ncbi:hypothetical protein B0H17DRAFT_1080869, partial [Mycena rosella]
MSRPEFFPWAIFSSNTLRPMMVDLYRAAGRNDSSSAVRLTKEKSIALLEKVQKDGLDAALKDVPVHANASASTSKRKHEAPAEDEPAAPAEPARKRGRGKVSSAPDAEGAQSVSAPPRTRGRTSDPGHQGLLTRRQAAQARGDNVPPTRSWKASARAPRKVAQKASGSASAPLPAKPKSKGQVFDGVVLVKRAAAYSRKGKAREQAQDEPEEQQERGGSDEDAEGEIIEDGMEMEMENSSLENSNKENDPTFLEIANADTDGTDGTDGEADAEGDNIVPAEEIGSPAPQITIEPTDDQIEDARNHDVSIEIGSPAPEITIEPMADDGAGDGDDIEFETNGDSGGGLLRPRINTHFRAGSLNPEYSIEVFSPTSEQHDSDDEMWVAAGVNGVRAAGGGLGPLDAL